MAKYFDWRRLNWKPLSEFPAGRASDSPLPGRIEEIVVRYRSEAGELTEYRMADAVGTLDYVAGLRDDGIIDGYQSYSRDASQDEWTLSAVGTRPISRTVVASA